MSQPANRQPAKSDPFVSIIILNYNGADLLPACLESLKNLDYPHYEVVVVENGSTDNSMEVLARFPWVRVCRLETNRGSSGGYNYGLARARGDYILMMNNDMVANAGFVRVLADYLSDHPEVGIVQGKMVLPRHGKALEVCGSFMTWCGLPYHYGYFKPDGPKYQVSYPVFCGKGACMMFRREVIEKAGGYFFNELFHCYYEETDFCHRAWLAGYETHFVPSPPVEHLSGVTIARTEKAGFSMYHYLRNMTFSLLTILEPVWLLRIMPLFSAVLLCSMLAAALAGRRAVARAHWDAIWHTIWRISQIRACRRHIQAFRKQSDAAIFAKTMRNPRLQYFLKTFQGRLGEYAD